MSDPKLSQELLRFIQMAIPSYDAAVLLVTISRQPERTWTVEGLAAVMGVNSGVTLPVRQLLDHFVQSGVLEPSGEGAFLLVPPSHESRAVVEELRQAYDHRPVTLIRAVDSAARAKIQSFADSFKLRRERE